ncbi:MAG: hypothetical protein AB1611_19400 [bacterium]
MKLNSLLKFTANRAVAHSLVKSLVSSLTGGLIIGLFITSVAAQGLYLPGLYGNYLSGWNSLPYYGNFSPFSGGINSLYGGYYGSPFFSTSLPYYSTMSPYNMYYPLMQICALYDYLNYALHFYELASQTPFLYMYDQTADYIGANLYNYASNIGVTPQESIIYFIQENFLSPQN